MKKSLLAALLMPFLLAGCSLLGGAGGDSEEDDPNSETGQKNIKIRFHVDEKNIEHDGYDKVITEFNNAHAKDGVKVTATYVARTGSNSAYELQLAKDMEDESLPDIITFDAPNCARYAKDGYLYDISNAFTSEEKSKFITLNEYQGKLYGIPIQESSAGFYYNKTLFEQAGINVSGYTVDNPWTFDQFKAVCKQLKDASITPVDMRLDATTDETGTYLLYPFIYAAGGSFVDSTGLQAKGYFDSTGSISGFQFLKDLISSGYTSYGLGATDFHTGKVGMYLSSGWTTRELDYEYKTTFGVHDRTKWGILPYPKGAIAASATGSWSFGITNNQREDKTLVIELLKHLTNAQSSKTITDYTRMIPANKDAEFPYQPGDPEYFLRDQLSKSGKQRPETVAYPEFSATFGKVISELRNTNNVAELVQNKATELQGLIARVK